MHDFSWVPVGESSFIYRLGKLGNLKVYRRPAGDWGAFFMDPKRQLILHYSGIESEHLAKKCIISKAQTTFADCASKLKFEQHCLEEENK